MIDLSRATCRITALIFLVITGLPTNSFANSIFEIRNAMKTHDFSTVQRFQAEHPIFALYAQEVLSHQFGDKYQEPQDELWRRDYKEKTKACPLIGASRLAIYNYTGFNYGTLNRELRVGPLSDESFFYGLVLDHAISLMPKFSGIVYRATYITNEKSLAETPIGQMVVLHALEAELSRNMAAVINSPGKLLFSTIKISFGNVPFC